MAYLDILVRVSALKVKKQTTTARKRHSVRIVVTHTYLHRLALRSVKEELSRLCRDIVIGVVPGRVDRFRGLSLIPYDDLVYQVHGVQYSKGGGHRR